MPTRRRSESPVEPSPPSAEQVSIPQPQDICELHDLPLLVKVACKKREDTDEMTNVIKGYKRRDAGVATPPPPPMPAPGGPATIPFSAPRSSTPAPSSGGAPWKRN